ncbi:MAG TPA: biopolymer transporter ExbD [Terriglobia bacterium]|nr:biopolymer transporter ExbD [Terriglobia bacterium]
MKRAIKVGADDARPMVEMNITPLIDVLLVLIITFMVVTNLKPGGLDAQVPDPGVKDAGKSAIVVSVGADHHIRINQLPVDLNALGSGLEEIFKTRNQRIVFVQADSTLSFGEVARVIDIAKGVGIDKIGLLPPERLAG